MKRQRSVIHNQDKRRSNDSKTRSDGHNKKQECMICLQTERCLNLRKNTFLSVAENVYMAAQTRRDAWLPYHAMIAPTAHVATVCEISADVWADIRDMKKCYRLLVLSGQCSEVLSTIGFCEAQEELKPVFIEFHIPRGGRKADWQAVLPDSNSPHYTIDCIPVTANQFEELKISFVSEFRLMASDIERVNHGFRRVDPKLFLKSLIPHQQNPPPYVYVDFGLEEAYLMLLENSDVKKEFIKETVDAVLGDCKVHSKSFDYDTFLTTFRKQMQEFDCFALGK